MNNDDAMYGFVPDTGHGPHGGHPGMQDELDHEFAEMSWAPLSCLFDDDSSSVTATGYDHHTELLWTAHASGRLTSYLAHPGRQPSNADMVKYSSFLAGRSPITAVLPMYQGLVSVAQHAVMMHTAGGAGLATYQPFVAHGGDAPPADFTCAHFLQNYSDGGFVPSSIIAGTTNQYLNIYDLATPGPPVSMFDVEAPTVKLQSTQVYIAVAGGDGKVRLMDGQLRSQHVIHTLPAHSGTVLDISLPFDSYYLATCGMSGRAINPYDAKSPFIYSADPVVQVFDLRMPENGSPLASTSLVPNFVRFLPPGPGGIKRRFSGEEDSLPAVVATSAEGYIQVLSLGGEEAGHPVLVTPVQSMGLGEITCLDVASSGRRIALGTSGGCTVQMYLQHIVSAEEEHDASTALESASISYSVGAATISGQQLDPVINLKSEAIEVPQCPPPPTQRQVSIDDAVIATSYTLLSNDLSELSSSLSTTPRVLGTRMRTPATRRINEDLLNSTTFQEFIGFVPNPGYPANSLIYGPARTKAYQLCDPRFLSSGDKDTLSQGVVAGADNESGEGVVGTNAELGAAVPQNYRRVQSHRGKNKMKQFNYDEHNAVPGIVGLENSIERPWINPMLQFLFSIPPIRQYALNAQLRPFHHATAPYSIWCELGFLFHIMTMKLRDASEDASSVMGVATASNFHTVFRHSSAAAAMGLLKDTLLHNSSVGVSASLDDANMSSGLGGVASTGALDPTGGLVVQGGSAVSGLTQPATSPESYSLRLQQTVQVFVKFLLQQLSLESELESKQLVSRSGKSSGASGSSKIFKSVSASLLASADGSSDIEDITDRLFGMTVRTTTTFLHSGSVDVGATHRTVAVELIYPPVLSAASNFSTASSKLLQAAKSDVKKLETLLSGAPYPYTVELRTRWTSYIVDSAPSFCAILWTSLQKELYMRGWCTTSETYEPFRQIKSVDVNDLPSILTVLCGDTLPSAVASSSGSSEHSNASAKEKETIADLWRSTNVEGHGPWMSLEVEVYSLPGTSTRDSQSSPKSKNHSELFVSEKLQHYDDKDVQHSPGKSGASSKDRWLIFNGTSYISSTVPASVLFRSVLPDEKGVSDVGEAVEYQLFSVISHVDDYLYNGKRPGMCGKDGNDICCHPVLHVRKPAEGADGSWIMLNDFAACDSDALDATTFTRWRHPDVIFFSRSDASISTMSGEMDSGLKHIPECVLTAASLSSVKSVPPVPVDRIPAGTCMSRASEFTEKKAEAEPCTQKYVAFDAEFVTVQVEETMSDLYGKQVTGRDGRQVVARISLVSEAVASRSDDLAPGGEVDSWSGATRRPNTSRVLQVPSLGGTDAPTVSVPLMLLCDDYVLPAEPVIDYVTRFSGVTCEDLNPTLSTHALISHRAAILKLRYYIDAGCVFVGHGLTKDFETANIYVPQNQIRDTVELWRLPNQRKISLRFLAAYLLKAEIQDELHDSIEDAKTAFALYLLYERTLKSCGQERIGAILRDLYIYGNQNNWTLGLDRIH